MIQSAPTAAIVAVAGRRIDAPGATPERFPLRNRHRVRDSIAAFLEAHPVSLLVASAACGADLIALEAAAGLGIRFRVILPFAAGRFRASSVIDRPGDWGPLFDALMARAASRDDLVVLRGTGGHESGDAEQAYADTSVAILDEGDAQAVASGAVRTALVVWDGAPRGAADFTWNFRTQAMSRGWAVEEIQTLQATARPEKTPPRRT
jgi:hypothetical protein